MNKKLLIALILMMLIAGFGAKLATSRTNISLNESALYPEDI